MGIKDGEWQYGDEDGWAFYAEQHYLPMLERIHNGDTKEGDAKLAGFLLDDIKAAIADMRRE